MNSRFMISTDGGTTFSVKVTPSGSPFEWTKDTGSGRAGKRLNPSGPLTFHTTDYKYLKALKRSSGMCVEVPIRYEMQCAGSWKVLWTGKFPAGGGTWDYRKCTAEVKPEADDRYTCILANQGQRVNLMLADVVTARAVKLPPNVEFAMCSESGDGCSDAYRFNHGWDIATTWNPFPGVTYHLYWRERIIMPCIPDPDSGADIPATPAGDDWQLLANGCDGGSLCLEPGTSLYVRHVTQPYTFGTPVLGTGSEETGRIPPAGCDVALYVGYNYGSSDSPGCSSYPNDIEPGGSMGNWFICLEDGSMETYTRARTLESCLELILHQIGCGVEGIRSDFFGINPPGDAPGYVAGLNYVTGRPTQTEGIVILHKTDALTPGATQPAGRGEMSFKELMHDLGMYQVLWEIDSDGYLRIEHYTFYNVHLGLDLTLLNPKSVVEPFIHSALSVEVPNIERVTFAEAQGADFIGKDIIYSGPCVTSQGENKVIEYNYSDVTTDIGMVINDPDLVSRKGFVFLACVLNGDTYDTIVDVGAISGTLQVNAPMSVANLQRDFWTWNRYLPSANMNGADVEFDGFRPTVQQSSITVVCFGCSALTFNPDHMIRTNLGQQQLGGIDAEVEKATLDTNGNLRLTLRYAL